MFVKSQTGKQLLLHEDFTYSHYRQFPTKGTDHWRCSSNKSKNCTAKIVLDCDYHILYTKRHNHAPPTYIVQNGIFYKSN